MGTPARDEDFGERFSIVRAIGEGGMGVVYEALDRTLGVNVALKTVRYSDPASIYRFKQEFRALSDVTHPNLVTLHELHSHGDRLFFTMELVLGVDLLRHVRHGVASVYAATINSPVSGPTSARSESDLVAKSGPIARSEVVITQAPVAATFDEVRLRTAFLQLCDGIAALHSAGKLHRDLKPSNVLVTSEGRVVLLDFGLATEIDDDAASRATPRTFDRTLAGTVEYMSPEQAASAPLDEASDWYSVGVMLYEALTGGLPIDGKHLQLLLDKQRIDPAPPSHRVAGIAADLDALTLGLLSRDPESRPRYAKIVDGLRARDATTHRLSGSRPMRALTHPSLVAPFVGRQPHIDTLRAVLRDVVEGDGRFVFVHGRSGMGKSLLVRRFVDGLMQRGETVVLSGRCYEHESVPYKAVDDLVDALTNYLGGLPRPDAQVVLPRDVATLARIFPVLRRVEAVASAPHRIADAPDPHELRRRAFSAMRELLARIADRSPLVLWIDDLQWGDADSVALLTEIVRQPDAPALMLIATFRSEEMTTSPTLQALLADRPATSPLLELGPLGNDDAYALAKMLLGDGMDAPSDAARTIVDECGGSPFLIDELARHVQSGAALRRSSFGPVAIRLDDVLLDRVEALGADARRLLEIVAIAGRPVAMELLVRAADIDGRQSRTAVAMLRTGNLVRAAGGRGHETLVAYHDRIRRAVIDGLDPNSRRRHHARLAAVLASSPSADPEALAIHYEGADDRGRAAEFARLAGDRAVDALAFDQAASWYQRALTLDDRGDGDPIVCKLGDALANAGRGAEAAAAYLRAAPSANAADALELRRRSAEQLLRSGHFEAGLRSIRDVLAAVGLELPKTRFGALFSYLFFRCIVAVRGLGFRPRDRSQVSSETLTRIDVCWSVNAGLGIVDTLLAQVFQQRQLLASLRAGELTRVARALSMEVVSSAVGGTRTKRRTTRIAKAASEIVGRIDDPYTAALSPFSKGIAAYLEGRWPEALVSLADAEAAFRTRCTGASWEMATTHFFSCLALWQMGQVRELSRRVPALKAEADERGDLYLRTNLVLGYINQVWLAADDPDRAEREIDAGMAKWTRSAVHLQHYHELVARTHVDLYRGDAASAHGRVTALWTPLARAFVLQPQRVLLDALHIRARTAIARAETDRPARDALLKSAERDARQIRRIGAAWALPTALLITGSVASMRGDIGKAARDIRAAITQLRADEMVLWAAAAEHRLGAMLSAAITTKPEGATLLASAETTMRSQDIVEVERFAKMLVPGITG